jgi:hypothetical protein
MLSERDTRLRPEMDEKNHHRARKSMEEEEPVMK